MSQFNFKRVQENLDLVKRELPTQLANQAQNYFLNSFKQQGWEGESWKEVQRRTPGTKAYRWPSKPKASSRTNPILIRTGALRRAVSHSIRSATFEKVRLVVDLPYAQRHNEGLNDMPKRHFMGDSKQLQEKQRELIKSYIARIWQK